MCPSTPKNVAVIGAGSIGRSWAFVFARAGRDVRVFGPRPAALAACEAWLDDTLASETAEGHMSGDAAAACKARVSFHPDLAEALLGAGYVQENAREDLELKKELFAQLDALAEPEAILASSTSALNIDDFSGMLPGAGRCIMVHPFTPPYVLPAVEILGNKKTSQETIERTAAFLREVGQKPVIMKAFVPGFIGNRMLAVLLREAFYLLEAGVVDVEGIDTMFFDALGLRWAALGLFGVNNANSDKGIAEYYRLYGPTYAGLCRGMRPDPPTFAPEIVARVEAEINELEGGATPVQLGRWRDKMVRNIRRLKEEIPHPGGRR